MKPETQDVIRLKMHREAVGSFIDLMTFTLTDPSFVVSRESQHMLCVRRAMSNSFKKCVLGETTRRRSVWYPTVMQTGQVTQQTDTALPSLRENGPLVSQKTRKQQHCLPVKKIP